MLGTLHFKISYLDIKDGFCKSAVNSLVSYSENKSCAEVLLSIMPLYITEELKEIETKILQQIIYFLQYSFIVSIISIEGIFCIIGCSFVIFKHIYVRPSVLRKA